MKNIFNPTDMTEILNRIDRLSPLSQPLWGKMNVTQMLAHNSAFQDIASGITNLPRGWLGMVVGRFARPVLYNEKPVPRNMSSIQEY
ncbi:hypothetical protein M2277_006481 [Paenibacillus sp. LBL]|nr:hypothetical protein [Paenibacillus sp. LBL]